MKKKTMFHLRHIVATTAHSKHVSVSRKQNKKSIALFMIHSSQGSQWARGSNFHSKCMHTDHYMNYTAIKTCMHSCRLFFLLFVRDECFKTRKCWIIYYDFSLVSKKKHGVKIDFHCEIS